MRGSRDGDDDGDESDDGDDDDGGGEEILREAKERDREREGEEVGKKRRRKERRGWSTTERRGGQDGQATEQDLWKQRDPHPDAWLGRGGQDHHPVQAQIGPFGHYYPHSRLQCRDSSL